MRNLDGIFMFFAGFYGQNVMSDYSGNFDHWTIIGFPLFVISDHSVVCDLQ